jgi:hypothetical protein
MSVKELPLDVFIRRRNEEGFADVPPARAS